MSGEVRDKAYYRDVAERLRKFGRSMDYFLDHELELRERYPDQWIAVFDERLVATSPTFEGLWDELRAQQLRRGVFVDFLSTDPAPIILSRVNA